MKTNLEDIILFKELGKNFKNIQTGEVRSCDSIITAPDFKRWGRFCVFAYSQNWEIEKDVEVAEKLSNLCCDKKYDKCPNLLSKSEINGVWEVFHYNHFNCGLTTKQIHNANLIFYRYDENYVYIFKNRYGCKECLVRSEDFAQAIKTSHGIV